MSRQKKIILVSTMCLLGAMLRSHKLWFTFDREFPISGLFSGLPESIISLVLVVIFILSHGFIFFGQRIRLINVLLLLTPVVLVLLDFNRLQPWFYFHWCILAVFIFSKRDEDKFYQYLLIVVSFVYVQAGFNKMNVHFFSSVCKNFFDLGWVPHSISNENIFAKIVASSEFFFGFLLLSKYTQKIASVLLIVMHLFILFLLFSVDRTYTYVIIPLNLILLYYLIDLMSNPVNVSIKSIFRDWFLKGLIVFVGIFPFFNVIYLWPGYMSYLMYSGINKEYILLKDNSWHKHATVESLKELKVPFNPSDYNASYWFDKEFTDTSLTPVVLKRRRLKLITDTVVLDLKIK